jgi:hypothetical protein
MGRQRLGTLTEIRDGALTRVNKPSSQGLDRLAQLSDSEPNVARARVARMVQLQLIDDSAPGAPPDS